MAYRRRICVSSHRKRQAVPVITDDVDGVVGSVPTSDDAVKISREIMQGAGALAKNFSSLFDDSLADSSWADRRARLPWDIFAELMRRDDSISGDPESTGARAGARTGARASHRCTSAMLRSVRAPTWALAPGR